MQPFVNVYTRFARADGRTVWLHMDQWEGQDWKRSPGNIYGEPVRVQFDPRSTTIRLVANKVIPPIQPPADTELVKRIKIESKILSKWWGHPIHLGATILLPKDYDSRPGVRYPVNYEQGHFSLRAPGGYGTGSAFDKFWLAPATPRMIYVTFLVKADNPTFTGEVVFERRAPHCWGPRGAELMTKMIAHIEKYAPAGADLKSWR